jgi:hypothetical protein
MKIRSQSITVAGILFASALWVVSQQTIPRSTTTPPQNVNSTSDAPPILSMDRNNWNVIDPYNRGVDLSSANTDEQRLERWKAVLAFEFPDEYEKRFPRSQEQIAADQLAAYEIEHPQSFNEYRQAPRTADEQRDLEAAISAIQESASDQTEFRN